MFTDEHIGSCCLHDFNRLSIFFLVQNVEQRDRLECQIKLSELLHIEICYSSDAILDVLQVACVGSCTLDHFRCHIHGDDFACLFAELASKAAGAAAKLEHAFALKRAVVHFEECHDIIDHL